MQGFEVSSEEAHQRLEEAIQRAGSARAYAELLGVSEAFVSQCRRGDISGLVLADLDLIKSTSYREAGNKKDPRQKQYENERHAHRLEYGLPTERNAKGKIRV